MVSRGPIWKDRIKSTFQETVLKHLVLTLVTFSDQLNILCITVLQAIVNRQYLLHVHCASVCMFFVTWQSDFDVIDVNNEHSILLR